MQMIFYICMSVTRHERAIVAFDPDRSFELPSSFESRGKISLLLSTKFGTDLFVPAEKTAVRWFLSSPYIVGHDDSGLNLQIITGRWEMRSVTKLR